MKQFLSGWELVFPVGALLALLLVYQTGGDLFYYAVKSPTSILEMTTGMMLLAVVAVTIYMLFQPAVRAQKPLRAWLVVYLLATIFFLGEDQNWGQYYLNRNVPDYFLLHNKEQEINLHNMSSWFNQKPRLMLELWVIMVGIVVPLGWAWPKRATASFLPAIFWPRRELMSVAILTIFILLPEWMADLGFEFNHAFQKGDLRFSEVQELYYAYFMLLYVLLVGSRAKEAVIVSEMAPQA